MTSSARAGVAAPGTKAGESRESGWEWRIISASTVVLAGVVGMLFVDNTSLWVGVCLGGLMALLRTPGLQLSAVLFVLPFAFAFDRYTAPLLYATVGYQQFFGVGGGLLLSLASTLLRPADGSRLRVIDGLGAIAVLLLAFSLASPDADPSAPFMFVSDVLVSTSAFVAARKVAPAERGRILDAIVWCATCAVIGRWILQGFGPSSDQFRASTNWFLGASVYGALVLTSAWASLLPSLSAWPRSGTSVLRVLAFAVLSAELVFLQVKTTLVAVPSCMIAYVLFFDSIRGRALWRYCALAVGVSGAIAWDVFARTNALYGELFGNVSDQFRLDQMWAFLQLALERPLTGFGYGGIPPHSDGGRLVSAHSAFIDVAVDAGLAAGIALMLLLVVPGISLIRNRGRGANDRDRLLLCWLAAVMFAVLAGAAYHRAFPPATAAILFAVIGLVAADRPHTDRTTRRGVTAVRSC